VPLLRRAPQPQTEPGFAELRAGGTRVVIYPALGGKIGSMEMAGHEWLWQNDLVPRRAPKDGATFWTAGDSGGYDECFPTIGGCTIPSWIARYGGTALPDRGDLWMQATTFDLETLDASRGEGSGLRATSEWRGGRLPYRFRRIVDVDSDGAVAMRYSVVNEGPERMPFLWAAHPVFPLGPQTRLTLPPNALVRVYAQHGIDMLGVGSEHRWPRLRLATGEVDLSTPYHIAKKFAFKLFLEGAHRGAMIEEGPFQLEVSWNATDVPNLGLWVNRRGWTPIRRANYCNFSLQPAIGMPDTLSDAIGAWNGVQWLEPGATRHWSLSWRATDRRAVTGAVPEGEGAETSGVERDA